MKHLEKLLILLGFAFLAGCSAPSQSVTKADVDQLSLAIAQLDPSVDPAEAARAANLAYFHSLELAEEYNVTDSPIVHNIKVNNGWRERGLCVHWAEDVEARLKQEDFKTLQIHRAIADGNEFRIQHSTSIISARGEPLEEGIVLDPWRQGGLLYWSPTLADERYFWEPRNVVLRRLAQERLSALPEG